MSVAGLPIPMVISFSLDTFPDGSGFEANYHFSISPDTDPVALEHIKAVVEVLELWDVYINGHQVKKEDDTY